MRFFFNMTVLALLAVSFAFGENDSLYKVYELNGAEFNEFSKTRGPKPRVKVWRHFEKDSAQALVRRSGIEATDSMQISLKDSVFWIEVEKNKDYTICVDDPNEGIWKSKSFSLQKEVENCIRLNSGKYVKSGEIRYVTKMGNVYVLNILVEMKYIDLRGKEHLLGYDGTIRKTDYSGVSYYDSLRFEKMDKVLAVDKYMVTECEFVQTLWDSIPTHVDEDELENYIFWVKKKKSIAKDGYCDAHDSAAVRVFFRQAAIYANARSLRDGFRPVYVVEECSDVVRDEFGRDSLFRIESASFRTDTTSFCARVDKNANGYRLPYYDEWMALARAGNKYSTYFWGWRADSSVAAQYAWFGFREPDDEYSKMSWDDWNDRNFLQVSCGSRPQKSRPVGMLKPNAFGLYDMFGLVCENVMAQRSVDGRTRTKYCKGGFLTDSLPSLNFGAHCSNFWIVPFQGLRLVRQIQ